MTRLGKLQPQTMVSPPRRRNSYNKTTRKKTKIHSWWKKCKCSWNVKRQSQSMKMKATLQYHFSCIGLAKIQTARTQLCLCHRETGASYLAGGVQNGASPHGKTFHRTYWHPICPLSSSPTSANRSCRYSWKHGKRPHTRLFTATWL